MHGEWVDCEYKSSEHGEWLDCEYREHIEIAEAPAPSYFEELLFSNIRPELATSAGLRNETWNSDYRPRVRRSMSDVERSIIQWLGERAFWGQFYISFPWRNYRQQNATTTQVDQHNSTTPLDQDQHTGEKCVLKQTKADSGNDTNTTATVCNTSQLPQGREEIDSIWLLDDQVLSLHFMQELRRALDPCRQGVGPKCRPAQYRVSPISEWEWRSRLYAKILEHHAVAEMSAHFERRMHWLMRNAMHPTGAWMHHLTEKLVENQVPYRNCLFQVGATHAALLLTLLV